MRITSGMVYSTVLNNVQKNYTDIDKLNYQASSLKKVRYASDSPIDTVKQMKYKTDNFNYEQFITNANDGEDWLNTQDTVLGQLTEQLQRARSLTIQAGNDTLTDDDREQIAQEINQILESVVDESNTTIGSSYLFGGTEILPEPYNSSPFVVTKGTSTDTNGKMSNVINSVEYKGDYQEIYREIEPGSNLKINSNGNEVFMATPNEITFPAGLSDAAGKLKNLSGVDSATVDKGYIKLNDEKVYYDLGEDSILDLKSKINAAGVGVKATVDGTFTTSNTFTQGAAIPGLVDGSFYLNGTKVNIVSTDTISDVINKINNTTVSTGVTASLNSSNKLQLSGGYELGASYVDGTSSVVSTLGIGETASVTGTYDYSTPNVTGGTFSINGTNVTIADNATLADIVNAVNAAGTGVTATAVGNKLQLTPATNLKLRDSSNDSSLTSNVFKKLGLLTSDGNVRTNLNSAGTSSSYKLKIQSVNNHQMFLNELGTTNFLRKTNVLDNDTSKTPPNNVTAAAQTEKRTIFDVLIKLRNDMLDGNTSALNGEDIGYLDNSLDNIQNVRSEVGAKTNRITSVKDRLESLKLNTTELLSDSEEVDLSEVIIKMQQLQSVQTSALKVGSQIYKMTLLDFL